MSIFRLLQNSVNFITFRNTIKHYCSITTVVKENKTQDEINTNNVGKSFQRNRDILKGPFTLTEIRNITEQVENKIYLPKSCQKTCLLDQTVELCQQNVKVIPSRSFSTWNDQIRTFCSSPCKGKMRNMKPCPTSCVEEEKIPGEEDKKKSPCPCEEWKKSKGLVQCGSICTDLKCKSQHNCGLEDTKIPSDCDVKPEKKYESAKSSSTCDLVPGVKDVCPKNEDPLKDCPKSPPPARYKSINPSSYLELPKIPQPKQFSKACSLLPESNNNKSKHQEKNCKLVPPAIKKTGKVHCEKLKCKTAKCRPIRLKTKKPSKAD